MVNKVAKPLVVYKLKVAVQETPVTLFTPVSDMYIANKTNV